MDDTLPDHRLDPAMMNAIAWGNGVADFDTDAAATSLENECGKKGKFDTVFQEYSDPKSNIIDVRLRTIVENGPGVTYNVRGTYAPYLSNFYSLNITLLDPPLGKVSRSDILHCNATIKDFDGKSHLEIKFRAKKGALAPLGADCLAALVSKPVAAAVAVLSDNLPDFATGIVESGMIGAVTNPYFREWLGKLHDGSVALTSAQ